MIDRLDKAEVGVRGLRVRETEAEIKEMRIMRQEREAQCNEKVVINIIAYFIKLLIII